ncbi:secreted protein [Candidatus Magnetomorum sp. HK-1]|nr:secreted protein [Candidatus Magnetomorum sp. HK-1]
MIIRIQSRMRALQRPFSIQRWALALRAGLAGFVLAHSRQAKANPLVPTLQRGNAVSTLQRRVFQKSLYIHFLFTRRWSVAVCIPTLERGNESSCEFALA